MTKRALRLAFIVGVLAIVTAYFVVTRRQPENHAGQPVTISGNYADDWMSMCGAIQGASQKICTARLDAAYGRVDGKPVPVDGKDNGQGEPPKGKDR